MMMMILMVVMTVMMEIKYNYIICMHMYTAWYMVTYIQLVNQAISYVATYNYIY